MLTESQARGLLHEAAETIEVAPAGPAVPPRPRKVLAVLVAAAAVLAVSGGLALVTRGDGEPTPAKVPDASSAVPSPAVTFASCGPNDVCEHGLVLLPSVLGLQEDEARARMDSAGQDVTTVYVDREQCQPDGMVLAQKPRAGTASPIGASVRLTVNRNEDGFCGGLPDPGADLGAQFEQYLRFPWEETFQLPITTPIELFLGNRYMRTIPVGTHVDRRSFDVCPPGGYAEASCPLSALEVVIAAEEVEHGSGNPFDYLTTLTPQPPAGFTGDSAVSLFPPPDQVASIMEAWVVQGRYDDTGTLTGINLLMGAP